jgi:glyoxylase-like metal-dependent hydrolase (beta-lactamase superfamily II)
MIDDTYLNWTEVADRCFVHRYPYLDVSTTVIVGADAAMVVDTLASARQGELLADQVRALTDRPVRAVVNTHVHFDHLFGNGAFAAPIVAHESVPVDLPEHARAIKAAYEAETDDLNREDALATEPVAPTVTFHDSWQIDLGDRPVELSFLGRGHTRGDIVVTVADANLVCAGDLIEESAPPSFGADCHPLDWPATLVRLGARLDAETVVVPGHGRAVDRAFVQAQQADVAQVADRIRQRAAEGRDPAAALAAGGWPWPPAHLAEAVRRGFAQLAQADR